MQTWMVRRFRCGCRRARVWGLSPPHETPGRLRTRSARSRDFWRTPSSRVCTTRARFRCWWARGAVSVMMKSGDCGMSLCSQDHRTRHYWFYWTPSALQSECLAVYLSVYLSVSLSFIYRSLSTSHTHTGNVQVWIDVCLFWRSSSLWVVLRLCCGAGVKWAEFVQTPLSWLRLSLVILQLCPPSLQTVSTQKHPMPSNHNNTTHCSLPTYSARSKRRAKLSEVTHTHKHTGNTSTTHDPRVSLWCRWSRLLAWVCGSGVGKSLYARIQLWVLFVLMNIFQHHYCQAYVVTPSVSFIVRLFSVRFPDAGSASFFPDTHGCVVAARDAETPGENSRTVHGVGHHRTHTQAQGVSGVSVGDGRCV